MIAQNDRKKGGVIEDKEQLYKVAPVARAELKRHVFVGSGKFCVALESADLKAAFLRELKKQDLEYAKKFKGRNPDG